MKWFNILLLILPLRGVWGELRAINVYGLETELGDLQCSYVRPSPYYIEQVDKMGFNSIRLPFSAEYVNKNDWTKMDIVVQKAQELNLTIILDYHRTYSGHQGDWYETNLQSFLDVWAKVLGRYSKYSNIGYVDLYNEFQQPNDKVEFWNDIMTQSILYLEDMFPFRFNWVVGGTNWGGNIHGINIDIPYMNDRIYYTIHKYWFSSTGDYEHDWDYSFGNHPPDKIIVGEFGWIEGDAKQDKWIDVFLAYLKKRGIKNTAFWNLTWQSGDTQGILKENCLTIEENKLSKLQQFWGEDNHRALMDQKIFRRDDRVDNLLGFISNSSADAIVMDEAGDDEDEDDWDDRRGLQGRWRRRKCHFLSDDLGECVKHRRCCANKEHGCWKCID
jgi:endoglucanase